jgi:uncharacterized protein with beta-barrel porin domain
VAAVVVAALASPAAFAALDNPALLSQFSPLEQRAAVANQATFNRLTQDSDGAEGGLAPVCAELQTVASGSCTGATFQVFRNVRELVHTSNALEGEGSTAFSLDLDSTGLGSALRWTAAEELAAQGSASTRFTNSQLNSLGARLSALRFGVRGPRTAGLRSDEDVVLASNGAARRGGGASADEGSADEVGLLSSWGGFVNGAFGYGRKADTTFDNEYEDAYDFDGTEITAGLDYRLTRGTVIGLVFGHTQTNIDFDSALSIVDGTIDSSGASVIGYVQWSGERAYVSGSVGTQRLQHDLVRRISYPSLNPLVASTDETARSDTDSSALLATLAAGVDVHWQALSIEPYVQAEYRRITIDAFSEHGANGFDFAIGEQDVNSLDTALGVRLQYALTPSWGVVVPFLHGAYHREFQNESRAIHAVFAGLESQPVVEASDADFAIPTDAPDDDYAVGAVGLSFVLKHGWQGFMQYQQVFALDTFTDRTLSAGIRIEF